MTKPDDSDLIGKSFRWAMTKPTGGPAEGVVYEVVSIAADGTICAVCIAPDFLKGKKRDGLAAREVREQLIKPGEVIPFKPKAK